MHFPWIAKTFGVENVKLIPIIIGDMDDNLSKSLAKLLSKYMEDEESLFVISSDFCHWGKRFKYTYFDKSKNETISQVIF
jgi:MEMO1 family protein